MSKAYFTVLHFLVILLYCKGFSIKIDQNKLYDRIVGGSDAPDHSEPYIASLRHNTNKHFCGGCIISLDTILTASHCIFGLKASRTFAVVGTNMLDSGGIFYQVASFRIHPAYDPKTMVNDIGLVKIIDGITFDHTVQPIALNLKYIHERETVNLSGWGSVELFQEVSNVLQTIKLNVISTKNCYDKLNNHSPIIESHICTQSSVGKGVCYGDSGSPLVFERKVIGLVSWGIPCAKGDPDVFTRVSSFISWIDENSV